MNKKLDIIMGDLLEQEVEVIVNPSSATLLEGGQVDSAIRKLGGRELEDECKSLHGCPIGEAKVTSAYNLKAKHIIHTPSPIWRGGFFNEEKLLKDSYTNSLKRALELGTKTIAFPSLSTGTHNFPLEKASKLAVESICNFLEDHEEKLQMVYLVCYDTQSYDYYRRAYLTHISKAACI